ncbi:MAG TPA: SprT family zinc-dependent metalloprotease [Candidatus Angelobacter sp.]|nr:SprT family zinc-dependent metalloprotease [Candidatus Angelobacter sp.]
MDPARPVETAASVELPGGRVAYTLRRSPRSRGLRVVVHPARGVIVTVPPATRRGWTDPERRIEPFLREREAWLRRHLARQAADRAVLAARGGVRDGAFVRYRGELHRLRLEAAPPRARRSTVARIGADGGDEVLVRMALNDRRPVRHVLEGWLRIRAREAIERAVERHAGALGVQPARITVRDQRTRWGSASRAGRLSFSWRLVLAPPEALETVVVHELAHLRIFGHGAPFWAIVAGRRPDHRAWRRWLRDHAAELHGALDEPAPADVEPPA